MDAPIQPALFASHGSPLIARQDGGPFARNLRRFGAALEAPQAIVIVSAHWVTKGRVLVGANPAPPTVHDFGGFPEELYQLSYPAPGAPDLAGRIAAQLEDRGFAAALDSRRGLDHGAWVPLRFALPEARIPVVQVSLPQGAEPIALMSLGRALSPLREEGVVLVGSGSVVHNLRRVHADEDAPIEPWAAEFDVWIEEKLTRRDLGALLDYRTVAPHAQIAQPTPEHFDPIFVVLGAAREEEAFLPVHRGFTHGTLSMRCFATGRLRT